MRAPSVSRLNTAFHRYLRLAASLFVTGAIFLLGPCVRAHADVASTNQTVWQMKYGVTDAQIGTPTWVTADDDGDGITNGAELAAGTNPFSVSNTFRVSAISKSGGNVTLQFPTEDGKRYRAESTMSLSANSTWVLQPQPAPAVIVGDGTTNSIVIPYVANSYYRIRVDDNDTSGSGVSDWAKKILGYNVNTTMTDGRTLDASAIPAALASMNQVTVTATKANATQPSDDHTAPVDVGSVTVSRGISKIGSLTAPAITVNLQKVGTATENIDYSTALPASVSFPAGSVVYQLGGGANQQVFSINPMYHSNQRTNVTAIVKALSGTGYSLGSASSASVVINPAGITTGTGLSAAYYQGASSTDGNASNFGGSTVGYSYSSTTGLATISATGFAASNQVKLQFSTGTLGGGSYDNVYTISMIVGSTFTVPIVGPTTGSGNCILNPPVLTRVDPVVDFSAYSATTNPTGWGAGSNGTSGTTYPILTANTTSAGAKYCVRWTGQILPQYSETYSFDFRSGDGAKVWVNGVLLIDKWVTQSTADWVNTINLQANVLYDIQIDHFNGGGTGEAHLYWWSPSQPKQIVPQNRLFPAPLSLSAKMTPVVSSLSAIGYVGTPFNFSVATPNIGGTTTYALDANSGPLPPAQPGPNTVLSLNAATGQITGVPTVAGTYNVAINATNAAAGTVTGSSIVNITIFPIGSVTREKLANGAFTADGTIPTLDDDTDYPAGTSRRLRGYIVPPKTGNYYFWLAASNKAELWISNDSEYVNRVRRATVTASTGKKIWNSQPSNQQTQWLSLVAGQRYYFDVLHTTAGGDDYVAMGWCQDDVGTVRSTPTAPNPTGARTLIPNTGVALSGYTLSGTVPPYIFQPYDYPTAVTASGTLYSADLGPQGNAGTSASGSANLRVDPSNTFATLHFSYQNLSAPRTAYHLHNDGFTDSASKVHPSVIIYDIDAEDAFHPEDKTADGGYIWHFSPVGSFASSAELLESIQKGKVYLNVHSVTFPSGEIRGNLTLVNGSPLQPEPTAYSEPTATDVATNQTHAARFLNQASFGASPSDLAYVQNPANGFAGWINNQLAQPASHSSGDVINNVTADINTPYPSSLFTDAWWKYSISGPDQLRQRLAFALSEIMVVSWANNSGPLANNSRLLADYYDQLVDYCLPTSGLTDSGTFRGILKAVTLTPAMGLYLDMRANQKGDDSLGRHPNENYAREIMQLFSVGLNRMWDDGTLMLDSNANLVPTYTQPTVSGMAALLTGWNYAQPSQSNGRAPTSFSPSADYLNPMVLVPSQHETKAKLLLNNVVTPPATGTVPRIYISSISTGTPSCTVTTAAPHGLQTGDTVTIFNVADGTFTSGLSAINGTFAATVTSSTTFTVPIECTAVSTSSGVVSGATVIPVSSPAVSISSIAVGNPCTVTTSTAHGLRSGDTAVIATVTKGTYTGGTPAINSSFIVTVTSTTAFTVPVECTAAAASGGTVIGTLGSAGFAASGIVPIAGSQMDSNGTVSPHPYDQYGLAELDAAIDNIVNNDNVPPYICRQLIQRFVTSNPSPGYLYRVVQKFKDDGSAQHLRGNMVAVITQVLLDGEARSTPSASVTNFGKQREPMLRLTGPARAFPATSYVGTYTQLGGLNSNKLQIVTTKPNDFSSSFSVSLNFQGNYTTTSPPNPVSNPTSTTYSVSTTLGVAKTWTGLVSIAAGSNCLVTTSEPHGLVTGNSVVISGVTGATFSPVITSVRTVTVPAGSTNTFTIDGVTCTGTAVVSAAKMVSNPCRVVTGTTSAPLAYGLTTGDSVTISSVSGGTFSPTINGTPFSVTVVDGTSFTIPTSCTAASTDNTGSIVGANTLTVSATGMSNVSYTQTAGSNLLTVSTGGPQTNVTVPGTTVNITSISPGAAPATDPCVVTTATPHNLVSTGLATIAGISDGTFSMGINGTFTPIVTGANTFTIPVNCTVAPTDYVVATTTKLIRSKVYLMFLSQTNGSGASQPIDGVYEVQTNPTSNSFTVQLGDTLARNGNVILPKLSSSYTPMSTNTVVQYNTSVNDNLNPGDHIWVDVPVVSKPVSDGEYVVITLVDEDHFKTSYLPFNGNGGAYPTPSGSNNGSTIYPLVAPPMGRSGSVTINQATYTLGSTEPTITQSPLNSPTVFNYFFPNYRFPGVLSNSNLDSPEFQLSTDTNVMTLTNSVTNMFIGTGGGNGNLNGLSSFNNGGGSVVTDISPYMTTSYTLDANIPTLVDTLASQLVGAPIVSVTVPPATTNTRQEIINFVANTTNFPMSATPTNQQMRDRVRAVIQLIITSAEYAVQK